MQQTIHWGIIGTGAAAQRFITGLTEVPQATLKAIWGRNPITTANLASASNAHACETVEELLASPVDAIYIATLPDTHAPYAQAALRAGKHVLCEKPVTLNTHQLQEVLAAANLAQKLFMEAMKPPFFPLYRRLREHLAEDPIGPIRFLRAGYATNTPPGHPSWSAELGGGSLMGIGVYQAFLAVDWLGPATEILSLGRPSPTRVDAFAAIQTQHADATAQFFSGLDLTSPGDATLIAPDGYATIHENWWNPTQATIRYRNNRRVDLNEPFAAGGFNYETAHFCDLIRAGKLESPILTHQKSLQVMDILDRARAAIHA